MIKIKQENLDRMAQLVIPVPEYSRRLILDTLQVGWQFHLWESPNNEGLEPEGNRCNGVTIYMFGDDSYHVQVRADEYGGRYDHGLVTKAEVLALIHEHLWEHTYCEIGIQMTDKDAKADLQIADKGPLFGHLPVGKKFSLYSEAGNGSEYVKLDSEIFDAVNLKTGSLVYIAEDVRLI